jgi:serine protease Do
MVARRVNPLRLTPVVKAVKKVSPAVINIYTKKSVKRNPFSNSPSPNDHDDGPYYHRRRRNVLSLGSGVIIHPKGYAVTNEHVVTRATQIRVQLADKRTFSAKLIGADRRFDLAVLKIESDKQLPHVEMGTSTDLMPGETVIAIGNPFGLSHTVSTGVISALKRRLKIKKRIYEDFIQTDTAINPGNSGGPLLNITGELIGINTAIHKGGRGIGFAIPIDRVKQAVKDLLRYGRVRGGWLGLSVRPRRSTGLLVTEVVKGGPAELAGIRNGDVIIGVRGKRIKTGQDFSGAVARMIPGEKIRFHLKRGVVTVKVGAYTPKVAWAQFQIRLGIRIADASKKATSMNLHTRRGVVLTWVQKGGNAHKTGLRSGDVIRQMNGYTTDTLAQLYSITTKLRLGTTLVMTVQRKNRLYRMTMSF